MSAFRLETCLRHNLKTTHGKLITADPEPAVDIVITYHYGNALGIIDHVFTMQFFTLSMKRK